MGISMVFDLQYQIDANNSSEGLKMDNKISGVKPTHADHASVAAFEKVGWHSWDAAAFRVSL
jgi:hypothetical protein